MEHQPKPIFEVQAVNQDTQEVANNQLVQDTIENLHVLFDARSAIEDIRAITKASEQSKDVLLRAQGMDLLGKVTTAMAVRCGDKPKEGCAVFNTLHEAYGGFDHRAGVAVLLINTGRLDVSSCANSFCVLRSVQRGERN